MTTHLRRRRMSVFAIIIVGAIVATMQVPDLWQVPVSEPRSAISANDERGAALVILDTLAVKGRAPKTGYARAQFGNGWATEKGCDTRNTILYRDMPGAITNEKCQVMRGVLHDPYTGKDIMFERGPNGSPAVQIDHVVALSNAWQTGAQQLSVSQRVALANDPLNLLAVDGSANQQKSDGDAATWLPPNKPFRCQYVARQIAVKQRYTLWVTSAEKTAMQQILAACPTQQLPRAVIE